MDENIIKHLLYTIYMAGVSHGVNDGYFEKNGPFDAFNRLLIGESPLQDATTYAIKEKVEELLSMKGSGKLAALTFEELKEGIVNHEALSEYKQAAVVISRDVFISKFGKDWNGSES